MRGTLMGRLRTLTQRKSRVPAALRKAEARPDGMTRAAAESMGGRDAGMFIPHGRPLVLAHAPARPELEASPSTFRLRTARPTLPGCR